MKNEWGFEQPIEELLNEEQVQAIEAYLDTGEWIEGYVRSALQGIVDRWYEENEASVE
jgi:predicted 2-oxoglutarate/Fe(II)-dependent dioxygenase YbiX